MSTFVPANFKCGLCGHEFQSNILASTSSFGSPALDGRPPTMTRATLGAELKCCPHCGYVHTEIEKKATQHKELVVSDSYIGCDGNMFANEYTKYYYRYALICLREKSSHEVADSFLHAAWSADDFNDSEGAIICRKKALDTFYFNATQNDDEAFCIRADIMRRIGMYDEVVAQYTEFKKKNKLLEFQVERAAEHDDRCYTVWDCDCLFIELYDEPFDLIKSCKKTVDAMCYDKKVKKLKIGDKIRFRRKSNIKDSILVTVKGLHLFDSFDDLCSAIPSNYFGMPQITKSKMLDKINEIYPTSVQKRYKALAVVFDYKRNWLNEL